MILLINKSLLCIYFLNYLALLFIIVLLTPQIIILDKKNENIYLTAYSLVNKPYITSKIEVLLQFTGRSF